jgi:hypothetical protein
MNWLKWWLYIFTYVILWLAAQGLIMSWYASITDIFQWNLRANESLGVVTSLITEITVLCMVLFLFFIPVKSDKWNYSLNINYYLDTVIALLDDLFTWTFADNILKKNKQYIALYNSILYLYVLWMYSFMLLTLANIRNWLDFLVYGLLIFIFISIMNKATWLIMVLDRQVTDEWETNMFLNKKNYVVLWLVLFILAYIGITNNVYDYMANKVSSWPILNHFDKTRIDV